MLFVTILSTTSPVFGATFETFLEPAQVIDISTPYRDRIAIIHVKENDPVHKGTLLAELETGVLKSRLHLTRQAAQFHGEIDSARALVSMRKNRVHLLEELQKSGNIRPQELNTARTELAMAKAKLQSVHEQQQSKRNEAAIIKAQIQEKKLTSPIDGIVVTIYKQQAELVGGPDSQPLLTIAQLDPLHAVFHLPPDAAKILNKNKQVNLSVAGQATTGTVDYISPVIDAQSGTITVRIILANSNHTLNSGSRCTLVIPDTFGELPNERSKTKKTTADQGSLQ